MAPIKGALLALLFVVCLNGISGKPFNSKYKFVGDVDIDNNALLIEDNVADSTNNDDGEEEEEEEEDNGSINERDAINDMSMSSKNATAAKEKDSSKGTKDVKESKESKDNKDTKANKEAAKLSDSKANSNDNEKDASASASAGAEKEKAQNVGFGQMLTSEQGVAAPAEGEKAKEGGVSEQNKLKTNFKEESKDSNDKPGTSENQVNGKEQGKEGDKPKAHSKSEIELTEEESPEDTTSSDSEEEEETDPSNEEDVNSDVNDDSDAESEPANEDASESPSETGEEARNDQSNVKMFFISPFEKQNDEDEHPSARQILTYPAKGHGWGHTHQFGPSHIWNSDYPYFAYGYSWGCGHHGYGGHGHVKKSKVKGGKNDETETICRDYMLIPAVGQGPTNVAPAYENGVARTFVNKDIACNDGDTECAQRQVIGSMAGGSMFGDGMGGLGLGFPGVPGIHTGISGYNEAGGFGDHMGGGHGGNGGHGGGHGGGGAGGLSGYGGGIGQSHFFKSGEHGFSSFWEGRNNIPKSEVNENDDTEKRFFNGVGGNGNGVGSDGYGVNGFHGDDAWAGGSFNGGRQAFMTGENRLPIHEASEGVGSGWSYGYGSGQWWDKTPNYHRYGVAMDHDHDSVAHDGIAGPIGVASGYDSLNNGGRHEMSFLGGPLGRAAYGGAHGAGVGHGAGVVGYAGGNLVGEGYSGLNGGRLVGGGYHGLGGFDGGHLGGVNGLGGLDDGHLAGGNGLGGFDGGHLGGVNRLGGLDDGHLGGGNGLGGFDGGHLGGVNGLGGIDGGHLGGGNVVGSFNGGHLGGVNGLGGIDDGHLGGVNGLGGIDGGHLGGVNGLGGIDGGHLGGVNGLGGIDGGHLGGGHGLGGYYGGNMLGGFGGHYSDSNNFGIDSGHAITFNPGHAYGSRHVAVKSKIKKATTKKSATHATTRQDIAMPDEQAMMDVTKQRQLIGSLGASTLFADNVGGMGLGHPGVPQMSSGVSGIPGEYGGSGGYSHGWDGDGPGSHPHGYNNYGYNGGDHDYRSETPAPEEPQSVDQKRTIIYPNGANSEGQVITGLAGAGLAGTGLAGPSSDLDGGYSQNQVSYANGDHGSMAMAGFPGHGTTQYTTVHHHRISHNDGDENDDEYGGAGYAPGYAQGYAPNPVAFAPRMGTFGGLRGGPFVGSRNAYHPRHVHVGVGTPGVKVEVETAKRAEVAAQKMSEIKDIVHDVSTSLEKTSEKLKQLKHKGAKRQITPAFTPVVSEPAGVPSIRYPVPAADRYPLGAGYIWPSANYGHQYGGPYAWSKSHTPKAKNSKKSPKKKSKKGKQRRSIEKDTKSEKPAAKRQFIQNGYTGDLPMFGMGHSMIMPRSLGYGQAGGLGGYGRHHMFEGEFGAGHGLMDGGYNNHHIIDGNFGGGAFHGHGFGYEGSMGHGYSDYGHHGGYPMHYMSAHDGVDEGGYNDLFGHGGHEAGLGGQSSEYGVLGNIGLSHGGAVGVGGHLGYGGAGDLGGQLGGHLGYSGAGELGGQLGGHLGYSGAGDLGGQLGGHLGYSGAGDLGGRFGGILGGHGGFEGNAPYGYGMQHGLGQAPYHSELVGDYNGDHGALVMDHSAGYGGGHEGGFIGHEGYMEGRHGGFMGGHPGYLGGHDGVYMGSHSGFISGHEGGYMGGHSGFISNHDGGYTDGGHGYIGGGHGGLISSHDGYYGGHLGLLGGNAGILSGGLGGGRVGLHEGYLEGHHGLVGQEGGMLGGFMGHGGGEGFRGYARENIEGSEQGQYLSPMSRSQLPVEPQMQEQEQAMFNDQPFNMEFSSKKSNVPKSKKSTAPKKN